MKHFCILLSFFFATLKYSGLKAQDSTFLKENAVNIEMNTLIFDFGNKIVGLKGSFFKIGTTLLSGKNVGLGIEIGNVSRRNLEDSLENQDSGIHGTFALSQMNMFYCAIGPEFKFKDSPVVFSLGFKLGLGNLLLPKNMYCHASKSFDVKSDFYPYETKRVTHNYDLNLVNDFTSLIIYSIPLRLEFYPGKSNLIGIYLTSQMLFTRGYFKSELYVYENSVEVYHKNQLNTNFSKLANSSLWTVGGGVIFRF